LSENEDIKSVAHDAFVYAYPMLEQVKTVNGMIEFMGAEFNRAVFNRSLPWENVGMPIVAPNLTSMTGGILLDMSGGPVTIQVPEVTDRYIVFQCIDGFTHNFYYLGTRSDGGAARRVTFHRPGQALPDLGATPVEVETDHAVIVIRIDIADESDRARLDEIMDAIEVVDAPAERRPYPIYDASDAFGPGFVSSLNDVLSAPPEVEMALFKRFASIGILGHVSLTDGEVADVQSGIDEAFADIKVESTTATALGNGWVGATTLFGTREFLAGDYMSRAIGANFGLWGNSKEEANYFLARFEGDGELLFGPGELPPLTDLGFWSITAHDDDMLVRPNDYDSYVITMNDATREPDGSLVFHFSRDPQDGNWMYTPGDTTRILLRAYQADPDKVDKYVPPPIIGRD
jgi:hypothetical protein